jgi:hypothetical protein
MKLIMTLLVRDEQDIVRENIEYHLSQGVDFIIATDNKSVDDTPNILKAYEDLGLLHYIYEDSDNYNQHAWVTRMARKAYLEYGADWVINNDADEFWWPLEGSLKSTFRGLTRNANVLKADRQNFIAVEESLDSPFWSRMVYRELTSLNSLGRPLPPKVAHRGCATVNVSQGNHSVSGLGELGVIEGLIEILHFPIRSYQQIENKIALGGAAYERNQELNKSIGITWRKLYADLQRDNNLNQYYKDNCHNKKQIETKLRAGEIIEDSRLENYFSGALPL